MDNENFNQNNSENRKKSSSFFDSFKGSIKDGSKKAEILGKLKKAFSRRNVHDHFINLQSGGKALAYTVILAVIVMIVTCFAVFFSHVRGPERVMVPEVRGKNLREALIEMQAKELYPKITQRYSDVPGDENTILEQSPEAGSIVRGYSRVNLVVSRGAVVQELENYVGKMFDDVKMNIQTMFAGSSRTMITIAPPEYKGDVSSAGTILQQEPAPGTKITEPVTVKFVVSRGPNFDNTKVPYVTGKTVEGMYSQMAKTRVIYDIDGHFASGDEVPGTISSQQSFDSEFIRNYTRMSVQMALPRGEYKGNIYGIFTDTIINYPYPVEMNLDATDSEGNTTTLVSFRHIGGRVTIPYAVPKGTVLTFYVVGKESKKITVN